jgi:hypothetical protein
MRIFTAKGGKSTGAEPKPGSFIPVLNDWVTKRGIPLPSEGIDLPMALRSFEQLKTMKCAQELVRPGKPWSHVFDYPNWPSLLDRVIVISKVGNQTSQFFHTPFRVRTPGAKNCSTLETWNNPDKRLAMFRIFNAQSEIPRGMTSYSIVNRCMLKSSATSWFKPTVAKCIYEMYHATNILDMSSGWLDRGIAAMATAGVQRYVGTDPNTNLKPLYQHMLHELLPRAATPGMQMCLHFEPAEEFRPVSIYGQTFDVAFTSCAYSGLELYAKGQPDEDKQCWKRYPTLESWFKGFLFPMLNNTVEALVPGGFLIINIADYVKGKNRISLCEPMNNYLLNHLRCTYIGAEGMMLKVRYGNQAPGRVAHKTQGIVRAEPIWVWQKQW